MLAEKIFGARVSLNELAGQVPPEAWEVIEGVKRVLYGAQEQAREMERGLVVGDGEPGSFGTLPPIEEGVCGHAGCSEQAVPGSQLGEEPESAQTRA